MERYCVRCGLLESVFKSIGKFGCSDCHNTFLPGKLNRFPLDLRVEYNRLNGILPFRKIPWQDISVRLRIARCFRNGFFPHYTRLQERIETHLITLGFPIEKAKTTTYVLPDGGRLYWGTEDHLRFEWIKHTRPSFLLTGFEKRKDLKFLYQPRVWAWSKPVGFINSCPTNCGRGDRLSIRARIPAVVFSQILERLSPFLGFGIDFSQVADDSKERSDLSSRILAQISCKNANPLQKLRFFKILGLLGLV